MNIAALPYGLRRFALQDIVPERWRNGAGLTRQVAAGRPHGPDNNAVSDWDWDWRISVADITAAGPFSAFSDIDRTAALVQGDSLVLLADEKVLQFSQLGSVHAFAGETVVTSQLPKGPARLLNVMARRGRAAARLCIHHSHETTSIKSADCRMLLVVRGEYHVALRHEQAQTAVEFQMNAEEVLLLQDTAANVEIQAQGSDSCLIQVDIRCY